MLEGYALDDHELLNSGELYNGEDPDVIAYQATLVQKLNDYNATPETPEGYEERERLLKELLGSCGERPLILPPVHANWGLAHVHIGNDVFMNFGATFVDDGDIIIGDDVMFGPNVTVCTAEHPLDPELRRRKYQFNLPVRIGNNVWVGAGAVILAGVTIGDNSVIGAGAVVTKDVPANVVAVGVPARVVRSVDASE